MILLTSFVSGGRYQVHIIIIFDVETKSFFVFPQWKVIFHLIVNPFILVIIKDSAQLFSFCVLFIRSLTVNRISIVPLLSDSVFRLVFLSLYYSQLAMLLRKACQTICEFFSEYWRKFRDFRGGGSRLALGLVFGEVFILEPNCSPSSCQPCCFKSWFFKTWLGSFALFNQISRLWSPQKSTRLFF